MAHKKFDFGLLQISFVFAQDPVNAVPCGSAIWGAIVLSFKRYFSNFSKWIDSFGTGTYMLAAGLNNNFYFNIQQDFYIPTCANIRQKM